MAVIVVRCVLDMGLTYSEVKLRANKRTHRWERTNSRSWRRKDGYLATIVDGSITDIKIEVADFNPDTLLEIQQALGMNPRAPGRPLL